MATENKWIGAKYPGRCFECNENISVNERVLLSFADRETEIYCAECGQFIEDDLDLEYDSGEWGNTDEDA